MPTDHIQVWYTGVLHDLYISVTSRPLLMAYLNIRQDTVLIHVKRKPVDIIIKRVPLQPLSPRKYTSIRKYQDICIMFLFLKRAPVYNISMSFRSQNPYLPVHRCPFSIFMDLASLIIFITFFWSHASACFGFYISVDLECHRNLFNLQPFMYL